MTDFIWLKPKRNDKINVTDFGNDLYPQIKSILISRGIDSAEKLDVLKHPGTSQLHSPWLMKDMDKAVKRVVTALEQHQKILVYGDYDVDGTTAIALVYSFLKDRNADVDYYVPNRYEEGYGVSEKGIRYAIEQNVNLIITLDCGIKAHATIELAQQAGIDVIVCDHHNQGDTLPEAFAVLDPKRRDCEYPFKELSGCGVGFKLLTALCEVLHLSEKEHLWRYLDYLAISTAADIVPIVDENRVYMYYGLLKMAKKPLQSVKIMLVHAKLILLYKNGNGEEQICVNSPLTVSDVVFRIAPKINAAGRMNDARDAIRLLLAQTPEEASQYFTTVASQNSDRQEKEKKICEEALDMLRSDSATEQQFTNVLYKSTWHKGVVGIAAAKILESYYKPTIILCGDGDVISGSARSVADFDLYSAIEKCSHLLTSFGGHTHAAGLSLKRSDFDDFKRLFENAVQSTIQETQRHPSIQIDEEITLADVTPDFYKQVQILSPFGPENMDPVFAIYGVEPSSQYYMGGEKQHLRLNFKLSNNQEISAVGFGMAEKWRNIPPQSKVDICFTIGVNVFRGVASLQLHLKDFKESQE